MKKILLIALMPLMIVATGLQSYSQVNSGYLLSSPTHAETDTATNSTAVSQVIQIAGYWDLVSIQPTFTKINGTVGGTAALYGSVDNVGYTLIDTAVTLTDVAAKTLYWKIAPSNFQYYKLVTTGTGSMSVKVKTPVIWRKAKN
jgi:hypothetical protein